MKKLTILCDMDGILVDLLGYWLKLLEQRYNLPPIDPMTVDGWVLEKHPTLVPIGKAKVEEFLHEEGFFRNAPRLPGGWARLKELHQLGHDVNILSSPTGPISAKEKIEWIQQHLPWLSTKNIMLANRKTLVKGDVLIDDHPQTMVDYANAWPEARVFGIGYMYNAHVKHPRVSIPGTYTDALNTWLKIRDEIRQMGEEGLEPSTSGF